MMDANVDFQETISKSVNNTGTVIMLIKDTIRINEKLADGVLAAKNSPADRIRKETLDRMEKRLTQQEKKNKDLEELQAMYVDEIETLSKNNQAAKEDVAQLKQELLEISRNYEESNIQMINELKEIDMHSINQTIELISLRALLPKLTTNNGKKLMDIVGMEAKFNEDVKNAAETIMNVLDDPEIISTFIGKSNKNFC